MLQGFTEKLQGIEGVEDIRGLGLLIGIELDRNCAELVSHARAEGLLINVTAERVVRLLPPLITSDEQAEKIVATVSHLIIDFLQSGSNAS
jgi:acetylornithine aminotransferase